MIHRLIQEKQTRKKLRICLRSNSWLNSLSVTVQCKQYNVNEDGARSEFLRDYETATLFDARSTHKVRISS